MSTGSTETGGNRSNSGGMLFYPVMCFIIWIGYLLGVVSYAVLILAGCMTASLMIMNLALYEPARNEGTAKAGLFERLANAMSGKAKYENDSMSDLISSFQTDAKDVNDSYLLLTLVRGNGRNVRPVRSGPSFHPSVPPSAMSVRRFLAPSCIY